MEMITSMIFCTNKGKKFRIHFIPKFEKRFPSENNLYISQFHGVWSLEEVKECASQTLPLPHYDEYMRVLNQNASKTQTTLNEF